MKTYLINSIRQVSVNSQSWDTISTLKAQEWIVYNEDISQVEKFLFIDDKKLLVSVNGKSSYSKWEYIKVNSSLIIDDEINKYLLKIVVCNKDIIVLNVDSTNDYSFLINSKSSVLRNPTYADIQWYLIRNCGVDILHEQQRNQFAEEKRLEDEKKRKEQQEKEREQKKLFKRIVIAVGIVLILLIAISAIKDYYEYKKYHPTILITEERNKVAVDLGLTVKWATCNVGANSPEEYGNYYGWGDITGQNVTKGTDYAYNTDYQFPPRSSSDPLPSSITNSNFEQKLIGVVVGGFQQKTKPKNSLINVLFLMLRNIMEIIASKSQGLMAIIYIFHYQICASMMEILSREVKDGLLLPFGQVILVLSACTVMNTNV